jgi:arylsulfate sulfotransferase
MSFTLAWATPGVRIIPSLPSPQPVGAVIAMVAVASLDGDAVAQMRNARFRYSVSVDGAPFRVMRDYSPAPHFAWRPNLYEHEAVVRVVMKNLATGDTAQADTPYRVSPRISGNRPVVSPTAHPLVALFSAPACPDGSQFRVVFQRAGDTGRPSRTGAEPCRGTRSSNVYVAGMRPDSTYEMHAEVVKGSSAQAGPALSFHTGATDGLFSPASVIVTDDRSSTAEPFILYSGSERPYARDKQGSVVWYAPVHDQSLTRMLPGGRFLVLEERIPGANTPLTLSVLDLAGNTIRQTNAEEVGRQVAERLGIKSVCKPNGAQCFSGFHHDAIELPNGHIVAIASLERMFVEGAQGSDDPVDIMATLLVDLDENLQVSWVWNAFDHIDLKRKALKDGHCRGMRSGGCSPVFLAPQANDWLHGNAVGYSGRDRNLVVSFPSQDWVVKVDYRDGKGSGKVLWTLGEGGNMAAKSTDASPWFSHQHDVGYEPLDGDTLLVFDNGGVRHDKDAKAHSRGQMWKIDDEGRTATLVLNADLGVYASYLGGAQRLANGNFSFDAGGMRDGGNSKARVIEVTPEGKVVYAIESIGEPMYRAHRVADLYTPNR